MIRLAIDASNIRAGGGLTHLSQLLTAVGENAPAGFSEVVLFSGQKTFGKNAEVFVA